MQTESVRKAIYVGGALFIGLAVCISVWFFLREYKGREIQDQSQQSVPNINKVANNETATVALPSPDWEGLVTEKEKVARQSRKMFSSLLSEEQLAMPFTQKMLEAMDSPGFFDLLGSHFTEREWYDFMESQGVPVIRGHSGLFRKFIPNMELADYEPVVRRKLAELFIATEPVDLTNPMAAARKHAEVLAKLADTDKVSLVWFVENFGEDWDVAILGGAGAESNPAFIWMTDVQRNAASIVAEAEKAGVDPPETQASAPSWDLSSVMEDPLVSPDAMTGESPSISPPATDALASPAILNPETDAAATPAPGLTDAPQAPTHLPTVEGLEASLKARFSAERFERAMSTLERYGPEEGLRRLRESDPEVAKQVENARYRNRESVPRPGEVFQ